MEAKRNSRRAVPASSREMDDFNRKKIIDHDISRILSAGRYRRITSLITKFHYYRLNPDGDVIADKRRRGRAYAKIRSNDPVGR